MPKTARKSVNETLEIYVSVRCKRWTEALPEAAKLARRAARAAWRSDTAPGGAEAAVVLADDAFVRRLNRDYRREDKPTNVLAFPAAGNAPSPTPAPMPRLLGDVVVAFETAAGEAADQGKPLNDHLSHLVVHGMLHLLGHDHQTADDAAAMERREIDVLRRLGVADPYADAKP